MLKHEVINILKTFSKKDITRFRDFLNSPYFNKSPQLILLFREIEKYYPTFQNPQFSKKELSYILNRTRTYNDNTMRSLLSRLLSLVKKFLSYSNIEADTHCTETALLKELLTRGLTSSFKKEEKRIYNNVLHRKVDSIYFYECFKIQVQRVNFRIISTQILGSRQFELFLKEYMYLSDYLVNFFISELLSQKLNLLAYYRDFKGGFSTRMLKSFLNTYNLESVFNMVDNTRDTYFFTELYRALYYLFSEVDNNENYFFYKAHVMKNLRRLSDNEISFHFSKLVAYCIFRITDSQQSEGQVDFNEELFATYNLMISKSYYVTNKTKYLSPDLYRNILILGLTLRKTEWVKKFIIDFATQLEPIIKKNMMNLAYAYYYSALAQPDKSLTYLSQIPADYFIFKYDIKNLTLKAYYELNYLEEALDLIHSYTEFLRTNKLVTDIRRIRHSKFIKFLYKLIMARLGKEKNVGYIKYRLLKTTDISYKEWLMEQYNNIC